MAADAGMSGHERPIEQLTEAVHLQLTTGDPASFHALAGRLFGSAFPDVERIQLTVASR